MDTVNQRIKFFVDVLGFSQGKFAGKVGIAQDLISRYVNSKSTPSYEAVEKIYKAFPGLSGHWMLTGEGRVWYRQPEGYELPDADDDTGAVVMARERPSRYASQQPALPDPDLLRSLLLEKDRVIRLLEEKVARLEAEAGQKE